MVEKEKVVIHTRLGQLRGLVEKSVLTENFFYSFRGIPYGKPPLGKLRFQAPQPFGGWEGVRDAMEDTPSAKQPNMLPGMVSEPESIGDEDCLHLNVYMNELPTDSSCLKPVIVIFNQGGFIIGSGNSILKGPDYLLESDIVVVTFNFRLGAFGFLSLENEHVPGNAGLKDQTLVLQWIHNNIDSFGGDCNNVTIFGISAGGASVHFHLLSSSSRGLFHKAVIRSGTALHPWSIQENPRAKAMKLAKILGCSSEDPDEVLQFLQDLSADDIVAGTRKMSTDQELVMKKVSLIFLPCVEVSGREPFLAETPESLLEKGQFNKVPVVIGGSVKEGMVIAHFGGIRESLFTSINGNPAWIVPPFMKLRPGSAEEKEAQKEIWAFYFKGNPLSWDNVEDYIKYQSDIQFNLGIDTARIYLLEKSPLPVYRYLFTDHSRCKCIFMKSPPPLSKIPKEDTCHGSDCFFFYQTNILPLPLTPEHKERIKIGIQSLTAFASTGDPNHNNLGATWRRDSLSNPCYMDMGTSWALKDGTTFTDRMAFWKRILLKYCTS